jgi:hypothetical protein
VHKKLCFFSRGSFAFLKAIKFYFNLFIAVGHEGSEVNHKRVIKGTCFGVDLCGGSRRWWGKFLCFFACGSEFEMGKEELGIFWRSFWRTSLFLELKFREVSSLRNPRWVSSSAEFHKIVLALLLKLPQLSIVLTNKSFTSLQLHTKLHIIPFLGRKIALQIPIQILC